MTFASETLGFLFLEDFNGYCAMDKEQFWKGAYTRVSLAESEIWQKPRRHYTYGTERFDEQVWEYIGACIDKQKGYTPDWEEVDARCREHPDEEYHKTHVDGDVFTPRASGASAGAASSKDP